MIKKDDASEYHSIRALSCSNMKLLKRCPARLLASWERPSEPTPQMQLGTYLHALVLEPETIQEKFHIQEYDSRTKDGREEIARAKAQGKIVINRADYEVAQGMLQSVMQNEIYKFICAVSPLQTELSFYWQEDVAGIKVPCKARFDGIVNNELNTYIIDLKTTTSSEPKQIRKTIATFENHIQAAWYTHAAELHGYKNIAFIFFYVEKAYPYICTPVMLSEDTLDVGRQEYTSLLGKYAECVSKQDFSEEYIPKNMVYTASLPSWYKDAEGERI